MKLCWMRMEIAWLHQMKCITTLTEKLNNRKWTAILLSWLNGWEGKLWDYSKTKSVSKLRLKVWYIKGEAMSEEDRNYKIRQVWVKLHQTSETVKLRKMKGEFAKWHRLIINFAHLQCSKKLMLHVRVYFHLH